MKSNDIILVCGKIKSGKSVWVKDHLAKLRKAKIRYLIWDYNWEYDDSFGKIIHRHDQVKSYFNAQIPFIVFQPLVKDAETFDLFCEYAGQLNNIVIICEEVSLYATSYVIPPHLKEIIDTGVHHRGLGLICTTRRVTGRQGISADIPFNAQHIIIFKQKRPQDLAYLAEFVGDGVLAIPKLPDYHYMHYDDSDDSLKAYLPI